MNEPIVEVIGLAHGEFVKNGVTVRTELGDSLPPIQGDRVQLQQLMLNLVINAIQAMSDVRDSKRELHVTTGVVESGESVRVAVRDTGPGPSAENVEGLFQPFYTTKPDGLDVGLSCASRSVDDLMRRLLLVGGGPIGVASALHQALLQPSKSSAAKSRINSNLMGKSAWAATSQVSHTKRLRDP
jgi:C4-dicarboxylate-specific signal transduction histidine kinase